MDVIRKFFEAIYDWWQDERAKTEQRYLARLKARDKEESSLIELEIGAINAETTRVEAETKLVKVGLKSSKGGV